MTHSRCAFPACVLTVMLGLAPSAQATPGDVEITMQGSEASGYAVTLMVTLIDSLQTQCTPLGGEVAAAASNGLQRWKSRNAPYVDAALRYQNRIEDDVLATNGETARKAVRETTAGQVTTNVRLAQKSMFPSGKADADSCLNIARLASDGSFDLEKNARIFPGLQQLRRDANAFQD